MKRVPWSTIMTTVLGAGVIASLGAAIDVRDQTKANTAEVKRVDDVQTERYTAILREIANLRDDIRKGTP